MRADRHCIVMILLVALNIGCQPDHQTPESNEPEPSPEGQPDHGHNEPPVVASSGEYEVTLEDYQRSLVRARLSGRPIPEKTLADPAFQQARARRLVMRKVVEAEAERRGIDVTQTDLRAAVARHPGLDAYEELPDQELEKQIEADLGVSSADLWHLMRQDALVHVLTIALLSEIDDAELQRRYFQRNRKVSLDVIRILNVPTSSEISQFVNNHADQVRSYYEEHRSDYRKPARAAVRRIELAIPPDASEKEVAALRTRAETLRSKAIQGDFGDVARAHSTDVLSANKGGRLPPVPRRTMPLAFELEEGEVSDIQRGRRAFWFIEVERHYDPVDRTLDAPLKREIASKLIQEDGASPSLYAAASTALEGLRAGDDTTVEKALNGLRVDRYEIPLFADNGSGRIPQLGKVPRVVEAAFALDEPGAVAKTPILDHGYLYLLRLREKEEPRSIQFQAEKDAFRLQVLEEERPRILWDFVNRQLDTVQVDLRTLQQEYGVLQSDGTVGTVSGNKDANDGKTGDPG